MNRLAETISEKKYGATLVASVYVIVFTALFFVADRFLGGAVTALVVVLAVFVFILLLPVLKQAKMYDRFQQVEERLHDADLTAEEREKVKDVLDDVL